MAAHAARRVIATSAAEALEKAQEMAGQGQALFHGAAAAGPVRAAAHDLAASDRAAAADQTARLQRFLATSPLASALAAEPTLAILIAHEAGLPTPLIPLSASPEAAARRALAETEDAAAGPGALYVWRRAALEADDAITLITPKTQGLWGLARREELFAYADDPDLRLDQRANAIEIVFPHGGPTPMVDEDRFAPSEPSPLELLITHHFAGDGADGPVDPTTPGKPFRGALFGRSAPAPCDGWSAIDPGWTAPAEPRPEKLRDETVTLSEALAEAGAETPVQPEAAPALLEALSSWLGRRAARYRGGGLRPRWALDPIADPSDRAALEAALDHVSARLALAPVDTPRWARAHAAALTMALSSNGEPERAAESFAAAFGEPVALEIASSDGGARPALVARSSLTELFDPDLLQSLTPYHRRKGFEDPGHVAALFSAPALLAAFEPFADLYVRQIAPSEAILEALTAAAPGGGLSAPLNPALVTRIGRLDGGPGPQATDPHAGDAIYIFGDMTPEEATFEARSALAGRLIAREAGGDPEGAEAAQLFVRFHDIASDVWDSPEAVALARALIEHGALATMQPSTTLPLADAAPRPRKDLTGAGGWGGVEVFAVATNEIPRLYSDDPAERDAVVANYENVLTQSRQVADAYWSQILGRAGPA